MAADPISALGHIRRIPHLYGMDAELMDQREDIIQVSDLKKSYGAVPAVNGISFSICKGQVTAMLGPNGAGKSTVLGILSTALSFDSGMVKICGHDIRRRSSRIRKIVGVVFQNGVLDQRLTVAENLRVRGDFYGLRGKRFEGRICEVAELTGITDLMDRYYGVLSGGQKRRCDIARGLIHSPHILFLDEPTAGLDPDMRNIIMATIETVKKKTGMTVLMTTHYMDEVSKVDKIIVMKKGNIILEGHPEAVKDMFSKDILILYTDSSKREIRLDKTTDALKILEEQRGRYDSFEVIKGSMENAYVSVTEEDK